MIELNLKKIFVFILIIATGSITYILVCRNIFNKLEHKYNQALNDYSMLPNNQKIVRKVEIREMNYVDSKILNTMVSNSLSQQEKEDIIKALEERNSDLIIGIGLDETGFGGLNGNAKTPNVKQLILNCKKNN